MVIWIISFFWTPDKPIHQRSKAVSLCISSSKMQWNIIFSYLNHAVFLSARTEVFWIRFGTPFRYLDLTKELGIFQILAMIDFGSIFIEGERPRHRFLFQLWNLSYLCCVWYRYFQCLSFLEFQGWKNFSSIWLNG